MAQVARFDIVPPGNNGARFKKLPYGASDPLEGSERTAGVVVSLFQVNRRVRPQAKTGRPAPVVKHALNSPKLFDCVPDLALRRLVLVSQCANNGLFCSEEIVVEQI
jgi:hypothetical protein